MSKRSTLLGINRNGCCSKLFNHTKHIMVEASFFFFSFALLCCAFCRTTNYAVKKVCATFLILIKILVCPKRQAISSSIFLSTHECVCNKVVRKRKKKEQNQNEPCYKLVICTIVELKRNANVKVTTLAVNAKEANGGKMSSHDFGQ